MAGSNWQADVHWQEPSDDRMQILMVLASIAIHLVLTDLGRMICSRWNLCSTGSVYYWWAGLSLPTSSGWCFMMICLELYWVSTMFHYDLMSRCDLPPSCSRALWASAQELSNDFFSIIQGCNYHSFTPGFFSWCWCRTCAFEILLDGPIHWALFRKLC